MTGHLTRLHAYTDRTGGPAACWPWQSTMARGNQPTLNVGGKKRRARALWWEHHHGQPPPVGGGAIRATCRNNRCVNPAHLRWTPPGPVRRNPGDLDPDGPPGPGQRARCARLGVAVPATSGEAAARVVEVELRSWGMWYGADT